jgi:hypothetical protein
MRQHGQAIPLRSIASRLRTALGAQNHMKSIIMLSALFFLFACARSEHIATFEYKPLPDVKVKLVLDDLVEGSGQFSTVHFVYFINNNSSESIILIANNVKAKINGVQTADTKYDSLASLPDAEFEIEKHESEHKLFFIIDSNALSKGIHDFQMVDFGLSINKNDGSA